MWIVKSSVFIALIFSLCVCFVKPAMHTQMLIYDSNYIVETPKTVVEDKIEIPVATVNTVKEVQPIKKVQNDVKKTTTSTTTQKTTVNKNQIAQTKTTNQPKTTRVSQQTKTETKKVVQQTPKVVEKPVTKTITKEEQEETIAWNKWHSDLQNSIMRETKLPPLPNGTRFDFTFTVDKYGKISDIQTWSSNPNFNMYAIRFIAPVIKNHQGRSILNFPANSQRFSTKFVGKFRVTNSGENVYSTAADFHDSERIKK